MSDVLTGVARVVLGVVMRAALGFGAIASLALVWVAGVGFTLWALWAARRTLAAQEQWVRETLMSVRRHDALSWGEVNVGDHVGAWRVVRIERTGLLTSSYILTSGRQLIVARSMRLDAPARVPLTARGLDGARAQRERE